MIVATSISRPLRLLHPRRPVYVVPRDDQRFMIGATMIENDERGRVTARSLIELANSAYAIHPAFAEAEFAEMGADVRPAFHDNLPRIERRGKTLFINGLFPAWVPAGPLAGAAGRRFRLRRRDLPRRDARFPCGRMTCGQKSQRWDGSWQT